MTDSVRCTADSPNQFTCEAQLDSDFETLTCEAPQPATATTSSASQAPPASPAPPSASNPAVSTLVSTLDSITLVSIPRAPLISAAALGACASSELSVVLAAATGKGPILKALGVAKAALDVGICLAQARNQADQENAERDCAARGGVQTGVASDTPICIIREMAK